MNTIKQSLALLLIASLVGCASNAPITKEQQTLISQTDTLIQKSDARKLRLLTRQNKAGGIATGLIFGALTGSFAFHSDGNSARDRLKPESSSGLFQSAARAGSAGELPTQETPTTIMQKMLEQKFEYVGNRDKKSLASKMIINVKPLAWQLYYDKLFNKKSTYFIEYASDITMEYRHQKIKRSFKCDKKSDITLTKEEWFANNEQRIHEFSHDVATTCVNQVLSELGITTP